MRHSQAQAGERPMRLDSRLSSRMVELILAAALAASSSLPAFAAEVHRFEIPEEEAAAAVRDFGAQAHVQILVAGENVKGKKLHAVSGDLTTEDALNTLLYGSGLTHKYVGDHSVALIPLAQAQATASAGSSQPPDSGKESRDSPDSFRLAQASDGEAPSAASVERQESAEKKSSPLEEVIVTGTHLKDVTETAAPVLVFSRADIDQTGLGSVGAFLQSLPQNFSNVSETTIASVAGGISADNAVNATAVNLHGMGSDATLVLVDGHRVAPGNVDGNFVDVSMIPLSAVERIEILTDGASAIYGSDAVGGVVNIIMRKDFDGLESRARFGTVGSGASHETQAAQTAGTNWGTGRALATYEFYDRTPLSAADRPYTSSAPLPFTLLPEQIRQSVFASLDQSLGNDVTFFANGLYSHRGTYTDATVVGAFSQYSPARIDEWSGTAGTRWRISSATELELNGGYASSSTHTAAYDAGTPAAVASSKTFTSLWTAEAVLRGSLGSIPAGAVQYAAGGQYRRESYDSIDYVAMAVFQPRRTVGAAFAELRVPFIAPDMGIRAAQRLELTIADREEHYSDFGSTNNPTFGLIWKPIAALNLRGTYGRSFVAPLLSELNPVPFEVVAFNTSLVPGSGPAGGDVNELVVFGGNRDLRAQTAKTWTIGADWQSGASTGLRAHLNYYDIAFSDRITNLQSAGYNVFYALPMASILGPQVVRLNPSAALVQQLISTPGFVNFGATSLTNFAAVIDSRELNLSSVNTRGLDVSVSYRMDFGRLGIEPGLDGTYILRLTNQFTATTPTVSVVNTLYNPTRVKARGHVLITDGPWSVATFVNYVSDYNNNVTTPGMVVPIASWTTIDLTGSFACTSCDGFLKDIGASLGVLNIANRAPPYAANANGFAVNYDGANASPLGRYFFLQAGKHW
jgi:iron complex outermembrane recepter protein